MEEHNSRAGYEGRLIRGLHILTEMICCGSIRKKKEEKETWFTVNKLSYFLIVI